MSSVLLSGSARQNIFELQRINALISDSQRRLATGKKVSGPSDNPAAFFDASGMRARADVLNRRLDEIGSKLATLQAADTALDAIINLVEQAKSDLDSALASPAALPTATGNIIVSSVSDLTDLSGVDDNDKFTVKVGSASSVQIRIDNNDTPTELLNRIDAVANADASFTTEGFLQIVATNGEDLVLTNTDGTPLSGLGISAGTFDSTSAVNTYRATTATDFDELRTQINELAGDAAFQGVNLLMGDDLSASLNESGSAALRVAGAVLNASGLNIDAAANTFQADIDINASRADLERALETLRNFSSTLGSKQSVLEIREDFTRDLIGQLQAGADRLTLADLDEESANLLALQTREQLASATLSLVSKAEQDVLRLF